MSDGRKTSAAKTDEEAALRPLLTPDKSLHSKITKGAEAGHILDQGIVLLGTQLVTQFQILLKTARIHERSNETMGQVLQSLLTTIKTLAHDKPAVLCLQNDFLYLDDMHLKINPQFLSIFMEFIDNLYSRSIGAVSFHPDITASELRDFAYAFLEFEPEASTFDDLKKQLKAKDIRNIDIEESTSFLMRTGTTGKQTKVMARHLYVNATGVVSEVMRKMQSGQAPNFKQARRVLQNLVDMISQDEDVMMGLTTLRCYDEYTHNHSVNVSLLSIALATRVGYSRVDLVDLGLAGLFHDMGKTAISTEILNKPGEFTQKDWDAIRTHPVQGVINIARIRGLANLPGRMAAASFEHHMNYDYSGFPKLSVPWEQSLTGRILMIADCYDAMTSARVYRREPISPPKALKMMFAKSGQSFDPTLLKLFVNCVGILPIGSLVMLDTKELAVVVRASKDAKAMERPGVKIIADAEGNPIAGPEVDLEETDTDGRYKRSVSRIVDNTEHRFDTSRYLV